MTYGQRDSIRKKKKSRRLYISVILIALFLIFLNVFTPNLFSPVVHAAGEPFLSTHSSIGQAISSFFGGLGSTQSLSKENQELKDQLTQLQAVSAEKNFYEQEVDQLHALEIATTSFPLPSSTESETASSTATSMTASSSGATSETLPSKNVASNKDLVPALILSKPGYSPYDTIIIDAGTTDGIQAGDLVLADDTVVLGQVTAAYGHSSNIMLYSSPDQKVNVLIGPNAIETTAMGEGGGNYQLKLPRNTPIQVGDIVSFAASPEKILGAIGTITDQVSDSFEYALFKNIADINSLRFVFVEKKQE